MRENRENVDGESAAEPSRGRGLAEGVKRVGIYVGVGLVVLLLGLVPMWLRAREAARGDYFGMRRETKRGEW